MRVFIFLIGLFLFACESAPHKEEKARPKKTTVADIEEGIRAHISTVTEQSGGFFPLPFEGETINLKLVRVHTEYLSKLGATSFFACVDLADESGDVYDVDFFLTGEPGDMSVTETTVHKENGKPFYTWKQQEDKTWKRVPVKELVKRA